MRTTATNRKLRTLLTGIKNSTLQPRPEFQRRLVWTNKDKLRFLDTVLKGYPFPEIYIAAGSVDPTTGEGNEMLVDGQQRITTLYQYFISSDDLVIPRDFPTYAGLEENKQMDFLEYEVVVRDLGQISIDEIQKIFERINSTAYSLNAMEIQNARYNGEFKQLAEELAGDRFFDEYRFFTSNDVRRMNDLRFILTLMISIMFTYFNDDDEIESYLQRYNDEFEAKEEVRKEFLTILDFISRCNFPAKARIWKKADFLTAFVELHRAIFKDSLDLILEVTSDKIKLFYFQVDHYDELSSDTETIVPRQDVNEYALAALQGTNARSRRFTRGKILREVLVQSTQ